jgi:hypothetical protein
VVPTGYEHGLDMHCEAKEKSWWTLKDFVLRNRKSEVSI